MSVDCIAWGFPVLPSGDDIETGLVRNKVSTNKNEGGYSISDKRI